MVQKTLWCLMLMGATFTLLMFCLHRPFDTTSDGTAMCMRQYVSAPAGSSAYAANSILASAGELVPCDKITPANENVHSEEPVPAETSAPERRYTFLVAISSDTLDGSRRQLVREKLFGVRDNLMPCLEHESNVHHRFVVNDELLTRSPTAETTPKGLISEMIEYDDIVRLKQSSGGSWAETVLKWAADVQNDINYDFLVFVDSYTIINLSTLQDLLESETLQGRRITRDGIKTLLWGSFTNRDTNSVAYVIGSSAVRKINLDKKEFKTSSRQGMLVRAYKYYARQDNAGVTAVDDSTGIVEWPNSVYNVPKTAFAVGNVFDNTDMLNLVDWLSIRPASPCKTDDASQRAAHPDRPLIAIATSSYFGKCMSEAAVPAANNKREYARKHGYALVPRSAEFRMQGYLHRKMIWGKIDLLEKILPLYDWVFWIDMDAVIFNFETRIEDLLAKFTRLAGGEAAFERKHMVIARPTHDSNFNAGVILLRNSDWTRRFLRTVQKNRKLYNAPKWEQSAMWKVASSPAWKDGMLLLDGDDHTFNTFPEQYEPGDFIVHYAPSMCPGPFVVEAVKLAADLAQNPSKKIYKSSLS